MNINVRGDRLYVVLEEMKKSKTIAGPGGTTMEVALPENHHERSRVGVVQQVGAEVVGYFPGDKVLLSTYAGVRIHLIDREINGVPIDEDRHRIIRAEEIIATID